MRRNDLAAATAGALITATVVSAGLAFVRLAAERAPASRECATGYLAREVRLEHQRLESDPVQGSVVVPNTWPEDNSGEVDRRYVVALVCVRPLTDVELNSEPYTDGGPLIGDAR